MPRYRFANLARSLVDRAVPHGEDHRLSAIAACIEVCGDVRYCVEWPQDHRDAPVPSKTQSRYAFVPRIRIAGARVSPGAYPG